MLTRARRILATPPAAGPLPPTPLVDRACRLLLGESRGQQTVAPPVEASLVATRRRPDSTIHIIRLGDGVSARHFYLKTLHAAPATHSSRFRAIRTEYDMLLRLRECFAGFPHLAVVRPVACFAEDLSLLTEEWPGRTLDGVLGAGRILPSRRRLDRSAYLCRLAGEWLRHFQSFTAPAEPSTFDLSELFDYCDERLKIIVDAPDGGLDAPAAATLARRLDRLGRDVGREDLTLVGRHNDFRPENMLTDGSRLVLLDFTGFTYGPRLYDFMKFSMKLEDLGCPPFGRRRTANLLQAAFWEGYGNAVDVRSPLALLVRVAFSLDKLSEAVDPDLPRPPLSRRAAMSQWYRAQRCWLRGFLNGDQIE